jgi:hypothetical protein
MAKLLYLFEVGAAFQLRGVGVVSHSDQRGRRVLQDTGRAGVRALLSTTICSRWRVASASRTAG